MRMGPILFVSDFAHLGSAAPPRSLCRLGLALPVLDFLQLGPSSSLRGFCQPGSSLSVMGKYHYSANGAYSAYDDVNKRVEFYVSNYRAMSMIHKTVGTVDYIGGSLHGNWYADTVIHRSDQRLKKNIQPLVEYFDAQAAQTGNIDGAAWVLRNLRPVTYNFRRGSEVKAQRFGFIAQELEKTLPEVVRTSSEDQMKGVNYQDLIAVLTSSMQSLNARFEKTHEKTESSGDRLAAVELGLKRVQEGLEKLEAKAAESKTSNKTLEARLATVEAWMRLR
ncbi:unnamed protein product [Polarella glacialis]|uniref:Peptidase S74 domain-containing protein n=1 Tax=Polarella glacialis TaxID=89957 RepID=A0A813HTD4_POLGL|nr:unnamed protein product [Polarella glacialis]